jgi:hypothetical protein
MRLASDPGVSLIDGLVFARELVLKSKTTAALVVRVTQEAWIVVRNFVDLLAIALFPLRKIDALITMFTI